MDKEAEKQQEDVLKRESLLNNAWRERAYEKLAVTPVSLMVWCFVMTLSETDFKDRSHIDICLIRIGRGFNLYSTSCTVQLLHVRLLVSCSRALC